jgi:hypothetical protein
MPHVLRSEPRRFWLSVVGMSADGYRHRDFDTRAGTLDVAIPKLRSGTYFLPDGR